MSTAAIVLAGGSGSRLQGATNKVFAPVGGRPLIAWSLRTFAASPSISHLVVVVRAGDDERVAGIIDDEALHLPVRLVTGGVTRHDSEHAGLEAIADDISAGAIEVVLIHDAARPFASSELIEHVATAARSVGGAVPALPLGDGIYRRDGGRIARELPNLYRVQTPQGFLARELLDAYRSARLDAFTAVDTSETVERYSALQVDVVPGEVTNIKVTFVDDLETAEEIAATRRV